MTATALPRLEPIATGGRHAVRWRPSRAGIVNVWRYYDETFEFYHGRLLLRGPNGSGKSKALEVLLPFLLDANLRPNRLSTFGTGDRTMHWNLIGEGATGKTRVGYVWLEFVRDGERPRWFSCGARLQASEHTTSVSADYFTYEGRISTDDGVRLVNDAGQPLTRPELDEALGERGRRYDTAADYRAALRTKLFGEIPEQRYDALITALLQLRVPKLSERLDPSLLSELLSRALPTLDSGQVAEVAEGFERLDRQREAVEKLDTEVRAAQLLANRQRTYAQRVLRAVAARLISATSELDKLTRTARESQERYEQACRDHEQSDAKVRDLDATADRIRAQIEALQDTEAYRHGRELDRLREQAADAARQAGEARTAATRHTNLAAADAERADVARRRAEQRQAQADRAASDTERAASAAGMSGIVEEVRASAEADEPAVPARSLFTGAITSRKRQIADVQAAARRYDEAVRDRRSAEQRLEQSRSALADATTRRDEAAASHQREVKELAERLLAWADGCVELDIPDREALAASAESEVATAELVSMAVRSQLEELARTETALSNRRESVQEERNAVAAERDDLAAAREVVPDAPPTRTADRSAMAGAPLWRLVSFRADVDAHTQANVEAALQSSGLLDAWVFPDGRLDIPGHDVTAVPELTIPAPGRSLADVLVPEHETAVPADRVEWLLRGVAYEAALPPAHPVAVGADGTWRLAIARGSWTKPDAEFIGAPARERARRTRIAELDARLAELDVQLGELDARLRTIDQRRRTVDDEQRRRPSHAAVSAARDELGNADATVGACDDDVRRRVDDLRAYTERVAAALKALSAVATEQRLPTDAVALEGVADAVENLRLVGDQWLEAVTEARHARHGAHDSAQRAERSVATAAEFTETAESRERHADSLRVRVETVEASVGADYRQVVEQIDALRRKRSGIEIELKAERATLSELQRKIGELDTQRSVDSRERDAAVSTRDSAAERFRHLAGGTLAPDAGLEIDTGDGIRASLDAARAVAAELSAVPHESKHIRDAEGQLAEEMHSAQQTLADRADLALELDDDIHVFTATVDGVRVGAARLYEALRAERDRSREDITSAERELFDKTLTGDTRRELAARIRQANELVDAMNERLVQVRTASQVAVQLVWQVDRELPAGTRSARDLLLKDPVHLSESEREALHRFFRDRIDQARSADTAATWEQQLMQVFDYTEWHQFVVKIDRGRGDGWQLLTKRLHGALSGGEKAIALHLPLFAAVAAHYEAVPSAPRLILLDEVFVGVDVVNRGQVFKLLASLDLDLVLTSDHEWCTYQELDGIAIHQLITGDGDDDAVTTARFVWDGYELSDESEDVLL
jgi:uncharacterized protein (TIGR02680 family)